MKGDLSNQAAPSIAFNVGALCALPGEPSVIDRVFKRSPKPISLYPEADRVIPRLSRLGFNLMLLVEQPSLYEFAQNMIAEHNLPVSQIFVVTNFDQYALIERTHTIAKTLWIGTPPFERSDILVSQEPRAWWVLADTVRGFNE